MKAKPQDAAQDEAAVLMHYLSTIFTTHRFRPALHCGFGCRSY
jgi:hypothetical protein